MPSSTCPICGQSLVNAEAARRAEAKLAAMERQQREAAEREARAIRAEAERKLQVHLRNAKRDSAKQLKLRVEQERFKTARKLEHARLEAAQEERKRHQRAAELSHKQLEKAQRELEETKARLEKVSADERGEVREAEVFDLLVSEFHRLGDEIARMNKTKASADIRHAIQDGGRVCGVLVYECKNHKKWSNSFVAQARESAKLYNASKVFVVSTCFPKKEKYLCTVRGVHVVHPQALIPLARVVRDGLVAIAKVTASPAQRERKAEALFRYIQSDEFARELKSIAEAVEDLKDVQRKERSAHQNTWAKQTALLEQIEGSKAQVSTRITALVERSVTVVPRIARA